MKKITILLLFLLFVINIYAQQTADSVTALSKNYKNNIQVNALGVIGYFSLLYEHSINKHFSIAAITTYQVPYLFKDRSSDRALEFMPQVRLYTQKYKLKYNEGFYISGSFNFTANTYHREGVYNPTTNYINLDTDHSTAGSYYQENIIHQTKSIYTGFGTGYKWMLKKRLLIDLGISLLYGIYQQERYKNIPIRNDWQKSFYKEGNARLSAIVQINIGYRF